MRSLGTKVFLFIIVAFSIFVFLFTVNGVHRNALALDELKEIEIHQLKHFNKLEYDRVYGEYLSLFEKHPESIFKYIRKRDGIISE